jgi:hypothetical protein
MRTRRITIEGDRYLVFYTFDDEPRPGPAASGDAGALPNERPGASQRARRDSAGGQTVAGPPPREGEGRDV